MSEKARVSLFFDRNARRNTHTHTPWSGDSHDENYFDFDPHKL